MTDEHKTILEGLAGLRFEQQQIAVLSAITYALNDLAVKSVTALDTCQKELFALKMAVNNCCHAQELIADNLKLIRNELVSMQGVRISGSCSCLKKGGNANVCCE